MQVMLLLFIAAIVFIPHWVLAVGLIGIILAKVVGMLGSSSALRMSGTRRTDE